VAATERSDRAGAIIAAALALPGVCAHAENAPEHGVVAVKYLHYQDSQPGLKRIKVDSPSLYLLAPVGSDWSVEGSAVVDTVSGATYTSNDYRRSLQSAIDAANAAGITTIG